MANVKSGVSRFWWIPLLTGLMCVALGVWCLFSPSTSLPVLAYIFAGLLCVGGVLNLAFSIVNVNITPNWGWALALGLLEAIAGVWMFTLPQAALATAFVFIIGVWILVASINALAEACVISGGSFLWTVFSVLLILATIVCAIVFLSTPFMTEIIGWLWLGISLITFGLFRLFIAGKIRALGRFTDGVI